MSEQKFPVVFVGGPIQHASILGQFSGGIKAIIEEILNGLEHQGAQVLSAHRYEGYGAMDVEGMHDMVAARDFAWMNQCSIFVAVLPDNDDGSPVRTDGTCVELGWASALGKPVVVVRSLTGSHSHLVKGLGSVTSVVEVALKDAVRVPDLVVQAVFRLLAEKDLPYPRQAIS